jgi:hypothetical protein
MDLQTRQKFIAISLRRVKPGSGSTKEFLATRTWRKKVTDLRELINTPYVIVGGVATRLYMPERMTDDLDILIHSSQVNEAYANLAAQKVRLIEDLSIGRTSWELPAEIVLDIISSDQPWQQSGQISGKIKP